MTKCVFYSATYPYCRKACRGVIHPSLVHPCLSGMSCCRCRWLCQCRQTVAGLRLPTLTAHPASTQGHRSASTDTETPLSIGRRYDTPLANYRRPRAGTRVDRYAHRRSPKHHVFPIRHFGSYMPPPGRHLPEQQNSTPAGVP